VSASKILSLLWTQSVFIEDPKRLKQLLEGKLQRRLQNRQSEILVWQVAVPPTPLDIPLHHKMAQIPNTHAVRFRLEAGNKHPT
jgi:hypothetical protein